VYALDKLVGSWAAASSGFFFFSLKISSIPCSVNGLRILSFPGDERQYLNALVSYSCALFCVILHFFCTYKKLNSFVFNRFRTLYQKTGVGG
jgi:hypothetical protein